MPTEVQIYKNGTVLPEDLSTGGPSWDTSGNLTATSFNGTLTGNVNGNATGLSGTPNITVGIVTASSFVKSGGTSSQFLKADGSVDSNTYITQAVPPGAVFHFAASTAPTGYLKANGNTVPNGNGTVQGITANFSALYAILGSTYGAPGKLPDLRGEFIRGWVDDKVGIDTQTTFGRSQTDLFKNHTHTFTNYNSTEKTGSGGSLAANYYSTDSFTTGTSSTGGTETRPRNIALLACIKY